MSWWAVGTGIAGALVGSRASSRAAGRQEAAANNATAEQRRQFDLLREDQAPFRLAGQDAVRELAGLSGYNPTPTAADVMAEPGYQFGLNQGINAIQNTAAARGGLYSGNALRELTRYGGDYATTRFNQANDRAQQNFGNRWNRLASLAGLGQTSVQQTGNAGMNFGQQAGSNMMGAANAQAAAGMNRANIWGNAANQLGGYMAWNSRQRSPNNWSNVDVMAPDSTGPY